MDFSSRCRRACVRGGVPKSSSRRAFLDDADRRRRHRCINDGVAAATAFEKGGRRRRRETWRPIHAHGRADAGKGNSEMVNDGKFICKRFFANFEKLKREVESEEAFFFNDDGVYCQVGTSIFDRWDKLL